MDHGIARVAVSKTEEPPAFLDRSGERARFSQVVGYRLLADDVEIPVRERPWRWAHAAEAALRRPQHRCGPAVLPPSPASRASRYRRDPQQGVPDARRRRRPWDRSTWPPAVSSHNRSARTAMRWVRPMTESVPPPTMPILTPRPNGSINDLSMAPSSLFFANALRATLPRVGRRTVLRLQAKAGVWLARPLAFCAPQRCGGATGSLPLPA